MQERQVTKMGGNIITLIGPDLHVGDPSPDFTVLNTDLLPKTLGDFQGKIKLISAVPSLDTGICDQQTKKFNKLASGLSPDIEVLAISMDLPFAQKRWCNITGCNKVETLSDHRFASFGENYGILIKELRLLNRSIFILDKDDHIRYIEIVEENYNQPDYDSVMETLRNL